MRTHSKRCLRILTKSSSVILTYSQKIAFVLISHLDEEIYIAKDHKPVCSGTGGQCLTNFRGKKINT